MEPWAIPDDVREAWIGPDAPESDAQLENWIGQAERLIRYHVPTLAQRIEDDETGELAATTRDVIVSMVTRVFRNPEGIRQTNRTTGPFTDSFTYGGDRPGGLYLSDEELARLNGTTADTHAYTVSMIPTDSPFASSFTRAPDRWSPIS